MDDAYDYAAVPDGYVQLTLGQLSRRPVAAAPEPPVPHADLLPLNKLGPDVFERLAAELVSRRDSQGTQFYGRSGQKQYGLDIVQREIDGRRCLYQVKRYQTIKAKEIKKAVADYAGQPRKRKKSHRARLFAPYRFVVVTSAPFEQDTANVNALNLLQDSYAGDLELDVWGAEELGRRLREWPRLVNAFLGDAWAREWCGFAPAPPTPGSPDPLGLVEDPLEVLNLQALKDDADAARHAADHHKASHLYRVIADTLQDEHFVGHAVPVIRERATALAAAGDPSNAFAVLIRLAIDHVHRGETLLRGSLSEQIETLLPSLTGHALAKWTVVNAVGNWYAHGCALADVVPALRSLMQADDADGAFLCCAVLEDALVDGFFDHHPPRSLVSKVPSDAEQVLAELRALAASATAPDAFLRARLHCAVADSALNHNSTSTDVDVVYGNLVGKAFAGSYLQAQGLVLSRAAHAQATHGAVDRAEQLWRAAAMRASEDDYYGDARHALRAAQRMSTDDGHWPLSNLYAVIRAMPHRRRMLGAAQDPALTAYAQAHDAKLPQAFGDTRRYLWESRLSGAIQEELIARELFGDVLAAAGHPDAAVETFIVAGVAEKAQTMARTAPQSIDVIPWLTSQMRRQRAAAAQVIGAQASLVPDDQVEPVISLLLDIAADLWHRKQNVTPHPELDALTAVARFGIRIPDAVVDRILELAEPALAHAVSGSIGNAIADLLIQTYWATAARRVDISAALGRMLQLDDPPDNLWGFVGSMPAAARDALLPLVSAALERETDSDRRTGPLEVLAAWRMSNEEVQLRARGACAVLLRQPIGINRGVHHVGTQESATVDLLLALADEPAPIPIAADELTADKAQPAGVVFLTQTYQPPGAQAHQCPATPAVADGAPDEAAATAAGPVDALVIAVAQHLTARAEATTDPAHVRARAAEAVRRLAPHIPAVAAELARRLAEVAQDPQYSASDLEQMQRSGLSRGHIDLGGGRLAGMALIAATHMLSSSRIPASPFTGDEQDLADQLFAAAARLLSSDDTTAHVWGARAVVGLHEARPEGGYLTSLTLHPNEKVRALGVLQSTAGDHLLRVMASDTSPYVRAAVAGRGNELPDDVLALLQCDMHASVRRQASRAADR